MRTERDKRVDGWLKEHLVCPRDYRSLEFGGEILSCTEGHRYPCIDGIPILLLQEVEPTYGDYGRTLEQVTANYGSPERDGKLNREKDGVDPYVQKMVAATCGHMYRPVIGKLFRYPIPDLRLPQGSGQILLDIGCGWGRWCISATRRGYSPVGIDPSLDAIRAARRVAQQLGMSVNYLVADARYLPFATRSFDRVFSYSVFQHFSKENVKLCLAEIARTLKPSGVSTIQMPNVFGVRNLYNQWRKRYKEQTSSEVRYWSLSELKNTFGSFIGPTSLAADGYLALGASPRDADLLSLRYRFVVGFSERLRRMSEKVEWMTYLADSLFVTSLRT